MLYYWRLFRRRCDWLWGSGIWIAVGVDYAERTVRAGAFGNRQREVDGLFAERHADIQVWKSFNLTRPRGLHRMYQWLLDAQVPEPQALKVMQGLLRHFEVVMAELESGDDEVPVVRGSTEVVDQQEESGVLALHPVPGMSDLPDGQSIGVAAQSAGGDQAVGDASAGCTGKVPEPERCVPASEA